MPSQIEFDLEGKCFYRAKTIVKITKDTEACIYIIIPWMLEFCLDLHSFLISARLWYVNTILLMIGCAVLGTAQILFLITNIITVITIPLFIQIEIEPKLGKLIFTFSIALSYAY